MDFGLKNKKAVITGASKGIGFATARELLKEGAYVVISGRNETNLAEAVKQLAEVAGPDKIQGYLLDGAKEAEAYELARLAAGEEGRIDVWVNNIGANRARKGGALHRIRIGFSHFRLF